MLKEFVKGNVYVFTKKKCEKQVKDEHSTCKGGWINQANGRTVIVTGAYCGHINSKGKTFVILVSVDWCKCIKNNNPKIRGKFI